MINLRSGPIQISCPTYTRIPVEKREGLDAIECAGMESYQHRLPECGTRVESKLEEIALSTRPCRGRDFPLYRGERDPISLSPFSFPFFSARIFFPDDEDDDDDGEESSRRKESPLVTREYSRDFNEFRWVEYRGGLERKDKNGNYDIKEPPG